MISKAISVFFPLLTLKAMRCANESADRIVWPVLAVARSIPILGACLAVGLTAKSLLNAVGCPRVLRMEGDKVDLGQLRAHAWLEREGGLLIGSAEGDRYAALPLFDGESK